MSGADTASHIVKDETSEKRSSPVVLGGTVIENAALVDMEAYRHQVPLWKRVWQHSLTQMLLLSVQAFCGPAMDDAISGEQSTPQRSSGSSLQIVNLVVQGWAVVVLQRRRHPTLRMSIHITVTL